jgi:hypothetical protein
MNIENNFIEGSLKSFVEGIAEQAGFSLGPLDDLARLLDSIAIAAGVQSRDIRIVVMPVTYKDADGNEKTKFGLELVGRDQARGIMAWTPLSKLLEENPAGSDPGLLVDTSHGYWKNRLEEERLRLEKQARAAAPRG